MSKKQQPWPDGGNIYEPERYTYGESYHYGGKSYEEAMEEIKSAEAFWKIDVSSKTRNEEPEHTGISLWLKFMVACAVIELVSMAIPFIQHFWMRGFQ